MKYLMGIVLMKMGHLRDIFVNLSQTDINLFYIFCIIIFKKIIYSNYFLNKNKNILIQFFLQYTHKFHFSDFFITNFIKIIKILFIFFLIFRK